MFTRRARKAEQQEREQGCEHSTASASASLTDARRVRPQVATRARWRLHAAPTQAVCWRLARVWRDGLPISAAARTDLCGGMMRRAHRGSVHAGRPWRRQRPRWSCWARANEVALPGPRAAMSAACRPVAGAVRADLGNGTPDAPPHGAGVPRQARAIPAACVRASAPNGRAGPCQTSWRGRRDTTSRIDRDQLWFLLYKQPAGSRRSRGDQGGDFRGDLLQPR